MTPIRRFFKSYFGVRVNFQQSYGWGFSLTLRSDKLSDYRIYGTAKRRHWELDSEMRKTNWFSLLPRFRSDS